MAITRRPANRTVNPVQAPLRQPVVREQRSHPALAAESRILALQRLAGNNATAAVVQRGLGGFIRGALGELGDRVLDAARMLSGRIEASVGRRGENRSADVLVVRVLLKRAGYSSPTIVESIEHYQREVVGLKKPDGRVDPDGRTISTLRSDAAGPSAPAEDHVPAANDRETPLPESPADPSRGPEAPVSPGDERGRGANSRREDGQLPGTPVDGDDFVLDTERSYLARLPGGEQFLNVEWSPLDYPGKVVSIDDPDPDKLAEYRSDPRVVLFQNAKGVWCIKGAKQDLAAEMFAFIAKHVRERRANLGKGSVLTKKEFAERPEEYDKYIIEELADIPSQPDRRLNKHAAESFETMRRVASEHGVSLRVLSAFRPRKVAERNAKKANNPNAVAGFSSHTLGLAIDLKLQTPDTKGKWKDTSTRMDNLAVMYNAPAYKWMAEHAASHDWHPFRMEPWHWEYNPEGFRDKFFSENASLKPERRE